ncbi:MAG: HlyD family efflux transporter periplasmic adaptor subunit, partial [Pseudomonadota bacterium]
VEQDVAAMEADVPAEFVGELEHAENQLALERAENLTVQYGKAVEDIREKLAERERTLKLDRNLKLQRIERAENMLTSFEIRASQPGFMIYGSHPWMGNKFSTGDTVNTGWEIARVADDGTVLVIAWINEVDAPRVEAGSEVLVRFDALPDAEVTGVLELLGTAPEEKADWGRAAYHRAEIRLRRLPEGVLLPGMSALIEVPVSEDNA